MAANANVELIRDAYEAFIKGDIDKVSEAMADDITWTMNGRTPLSGVRRSKQEVFEFFGQLIEQTGGTFTLEVQEVMGSGDRVVVLVAERAERNGKTLRNNDAHVWRLKDGKAVEFTAMYSDPVAGEEFWS